MFFFLSIYLLKLRMYNLSLLQHIIINEQHKNAKI